MKNFINMLNDDTMKETLEYEGVNNKGFRDCVSDLILCSRRDKFKSPLDLKAHLITQVNEIIYASANEEMDLLAPHSSWGDVYDRMEKIRQSSGSVRF